MRTRGNTYKRRMQRQRGMAMLIVLFVVMAIAVIAMGFMSRADMSLASSQNLCRRVQTEYTALAGLEHARALVLSNPVPNPIATWQQSGLQIEPDANLYYDLNIQNPQITGGDPNTATYLYPVQCEGYFLSAGNKCAQSSINASVLYTPASGKAVYRAMKRQ